MSMTSHEARVSQGTRARSRVSCLEMRKEFCNG